MAKVVNAELDTIYDDGNDFALGSEYEDESGRVYVFVKYNDGDGNVAGAAGLLVVGLDSAFPEFEVTADLNSATVPALVNLPRGFLQAALTLGKFGWAQKKGRNRKAITTDGSVDQGEALVPTTGDGTVAGTASAAINDVGIALETDSGTTLAAGYAFINIP